MIALTFALPTESSGIVQSHLQEKKITKCGSGKIIYGKMLTYDVAIFYTGVGRKACERNIDDFLRAVQPKLLISCGFAGAVGAELKVGDVIVGQNFSDPGLITKFPRRVKLFTATSIVDSVEERNRIARESGAAAVDMETELISRACAERGVRMLSLRAISDTPEAPFPLPPSILFDVDRQKTDGARLFWYLVRHPSAIWRLIRFSRQIAKAREALTQALVPFFSAVDL